MKQQIMSLSFDNVTMDEAINIALKCIEDNEKCMVITPNAEIAYMSKKNERLRNIINNAKLVLPDGIGVVLASKILKAPLKQKVAGIEFGENIIKKADSPIYFLGSKPGIGQSAKDNLLKKYPNCKIVGISDGYFKNSEDVVKKINDSGAKIVFVCLGAPKQEFFMAENIDKINANVLMGLGGSLDVFAGEVKRAPDFFVKLGLEWFYRLIKQPSRIKRMCVLPLYVFDSVKYRIRGNKNA